jgi:hypothetical protein
VLGTARWVAIGCVLIVVARGFVIADFYWRRGPGLDVLDDVGVDAVDGIQHGQDET